VDIKDTQPLQIMKTITFLDFAVIAAPLTLAALALLFFGRRHIYRQMDDIAEAAKARSSTRSCPQNGAEACSCDSPATPHSH
jgi:hypothetical protein